MIYFILTKQRMEHPFNKIEKSSRTKESQSRKQLKNFYSGSIDWYIGREENDETSINIQVYSISKAFLLAIRESMVWCWSLH